MPSTSLPRRDELLICFAHAAYRMKDAFLRRETGINDRGALCRTCFGAAGSCDRGIGVLADELRIERCASFSQSAQERIITIWAFPGKRVRLASAKGANANAMPSTPWH